MSKILGIDYGSSKVGLALADLITKLAMPLAVIQPNQLILRIKELIDTEEVSAIVIGLPLGMDNQETNQTKEVLDFVNHLKIQLDKLNVDVITEDERLSTAQAQKQGKDDAVAAMYILQSYIDKKYGSHHHF